MNQGELAGWKINAFHVLVWTVSETFLKEETAQRIDQTKRAAAGPRKDERRRLRGPPDRRAGASRRAAHS